MSEGSETVKVQTLRKLLKCLKTSPKETDLAENPSKLTIPLFPHQKRALSWLFWRENQTPSGGLLADDMGLGKTLTMISLVLQSQELNPRAKTIRKSNGYYPGGTLIVCPTSLLDQWASEIEGKTKPGSLSVEIYHGKNRETEAKSLAKHDVVITTYGIIRNENSSDDGPIFDVKWRRIILDEAHEIRNHNTQVCDAACDLEGKSRWALTGTPIHNRESDMYAILKFLRFAPFDNLQVWEEWFQDEDPEGQRRQQVVVASFMLRRTKADMIAQGLFKNLPKQDKKLVHIDLEDEEMDLYRQIYERSRTRFRLYLDENQSEVGTSLPATTTTTTTTTTTNTDTILKLLLRLRQICNHPHLVQEVIINGDLDVDSDPFDEVFSENYRSTKIKILLQFLKEKIDSGDKVVVVSQWTSFLQIIATHLKEEKIKFDTFHGAIKADERMPIVKNINNPRSKTKVLLLSLKAGGVGLNLIGANHLFLLDLYWNPQLEIQAQDRIYRMGQTKPVFIYKFLANGTIEEKIKSLQEKKIKIMTTILQGAQHQENLSLEDLKLLFDLA